MSSWLNAKDSFKKRYEVLTKYTQNQLPKDLSTLSESTAKYIAKGGISSDPAQNGDYNQAVQTAQTINSNKQEFQKLNADISAKIQELTQSNDMGRLLLENGNLQQEIQTVEKEDTEMEHDVQSAELRDELLRTSDSHITHHQYFLLGRPLRQSTIPFIWALSIIFIGISLLVFQQYSPSLEFIAVWLATPTDWLGILQNSQILGTIIGILTIVVIFLALRIVNII